MGGERSVVGLDVVGVWPCEQGSNEFINSWRDYPVIVKLLHICLSQSQKYLLTKR